jgi:hypothetical protein
VFIWNGGPLRFRRYVDVEVTHQTASARPLLQRPPGRYATECDAEQDG